MMSPNIRSFQVQLNAPRIVLSPSIHFVISSLSFKYTELNFSDLFRVKLEWSLNCLIKLERQRALIHMFNKMGKLSLHLDLFMKHKTYPIA